MSLPRINTTFVYLMDYMMDLKPEWRVLSKLPNFPENSFGFHDGLRFKFLIYEKFNSIVALVGKKLIRYSIDHGKLLKVVSLSKYSSFLVKLDDEVFMIEQGNRLILRTLSKLDKVMKEIETPEITSTFSEFRVFYKMGLLLRPRMVAIFATADNDVSDTDEIYEFIFIVFNIDTEESKICRVNSLLREKSWEFDAPDSMILSKTLPNTVYFNYYTDEDFERMALYNLDDEKMEVIHCLNTNSEEISKVSSYLTKNSEKEYFIACGKNIYFYDIGNTEFIHKVVSFQETQVYRVTKYDSVREDYLLLGMNLGKIGLFKLGRISPKNSKFVHFQEFPKELIGGIGVFDIKTTGFRFLLFHKKSVSIQEYSNIVVSVTGDDIECQDLEERISYMLDFQEEYLGEESQSVSVRISDKTWEVLAFLVIKTV